MAADSAELVGLALSMLDCSQKELASRLKVSPPQITKWKKGEYMSDDMSDRIRKLIKIGDLEPAVILWAGSIENARQWIAVFNKLAEHADGISDTGYKTDPFEDPEWLSLFTVNVLNDLGVAPPKALPEDISTLLSRNNKRELINGYTPLVLAIYRSFTHVYGFYSAYISDLIFGDSAQSVDLLETNAINIEPNLLRLAASKVRDIDEKFAPKVRQFSNKVHNDYKTWLTELKEDIVRMRLPLRAEFMNLVEEQHDELGRTAGAEALGMYESRLHPDIYINELLVGMRFIRQVLPVIMTKIGMDANEFADSNSATPLPSRNE